MRILGLVVLWLGVVGFGLCGALSLFGLPALLPLTAVMVVLAWLCVLGIRRLQRPPPAAAEAVERARDD